MSIILRYAILQTGMSGPCYVLNQTFLKNKNSLKMKKLLFQLSLVFALFIASAINHLHAQTGCSGSSECICDELIVTVESLNQFDFQLNFGSPTHGFCGDPITQSGLYSYTIDASGIFYFLDLDGDLTNVSLSVNISGCGVNETVILNSSNSEHIIHFEDQCTIPCSPSEDCPCDQSLNVIDLGGEPFELLYGTLNGWCTTITDAGVYNAAADGEDAQYFLTLNGSLNGVTVLVDITGCGITETVTLNSQNDFYTFNTAVCGTGPVCELPSAPAEVVYAGCIPHGFGQSRLFDLIFPGFPDVDLNDITINAPNNISEELIYIDNQGRVRYTGKIDTGSGGFCFTISTGDDCSQQHCIELPSCPPVSCDCLLYRPVSCYADGSQFSIDMDVFYRSTVNGVADHIYAYNIENPGGPDFPGSQGEWDLNYFDAPVNGDQASSIALYGTDLNNDGLVSIQIQIRNAEGQVLCSDLHQFNPNYICDDFALLEYIFINGNSPTSNDDDGGEGEGRGKSADNSVKKEGIISTADISVFPVPASDYITIKNHEQQSLSIEVLHIDGRLISKSAFSPDHLQIIQSGEFPAGVYLLRAVDNQNNVLFNKLVPVSH